MKEEEIFNRIEKYLTGELIGKERDDFAKAIASDQELKKQVQSHMGVDQLLEYQLEKDLRQNMEQWSSPLKGKNMSMARRLRRIGSIAAGFAILLIGGFWYAGSNYGRQALISKYYSVPISPLTRVTTVDTDDPYNLGMESFSAQQWEQAITFLSTVEPGFTHYDDARLYLGHAYLNQKEYEAANSIFDSLELMDPSLDWLHVLSLMGSRSNKDSLDNAIQEILGTPNHPFHDQATALQKELNTVWTWWY